MKNEIGILILLIYFFTLNCCYANINEKHLTKWNFKSDPTEKQETVKLEFSLNNNFNLKNFIDNLNESKGENGSKMQVK